MNFLVLAALAAIDAIPVGAPLELISAQGISLDRAMAAEVEVLDDGRFAVAYYTFFFGIGSLKISWFNADGTPAAATTFIADTQNTRDFDLVLGGDGNAYIGYSTGISTSNVTVRRFNWTALEPTWTTNPATSLLDRSKESVSLAFRADGSLMCAWQVAFSVTDLDVYGRLLDPATGSGVAGNDRVLAGSSANEGFPRLAGRPATAPGTDSGALVYLLPGNPSGNTLGLLTLTSNFSPGASVVVPTTSERTILSTAVAIDGAGTRYVAYEVAEASSSTETTDISISRYSAALAAEGDPIRVVSNPIEAASSLERLGSLRVDSQGRGLIAYSLGSSAPVTRFRAFGPGFTDNGSAGTAFNATLGLGGSAGLSPTSGRAIVHDTTIAGSNSIIRAQRYLLPVDGPTDSDGDGFTDRYEGQTGSNPLDSSDVPGALDLNGDGEVTTEDALLLYRNRVGTVETLPLGS